MATTVSQPAQPAGTASHEASLTPALVVLGAGAVGLGALLLLRPAKVGPPGPPGPPGAAGPPGQPSPPSTLVAAVTRAALRPQDYISIYASPLVDPSNELSQIATGTTIYLTKSQPAGGFYPVQLSGGGIGFVRQQDIAAVAR